MHVYGILQSMWRTAGSRNLCGICGRGSTTHTAYTAGVPQFMRYIRPGLRNLYYATIYPFRNIQSSVRYISAQCRIADTEAYRHKLVSFSFPQSSHYIKKAQGCAEGTDKSLLRFLCFPKKIFPHFINENIYIFQKKI